MLEKMWNEHESAPILPKPSEDEVLDNCDSKHFGGLVTKPLTEVQENFARGAIGSTAATKAPAMGFMFNETSRYHRDFVELGVLGVGAFGKSCIGDL